MSVYRIAALVFALGLVLVACEAPQRADLSDAQLVVEMRDYTVKPSVSTVKAGTVKIGVRNLGGMVHEVAVLKTDIAPDQLPKDGLTAKVKEDGRVAKAENVGAGRSAVLTADLVPGNYVLVCNIPGHHQLGMFASFRVE